MPNDDQRSADLDALRAMIEQGILEDIVRRIVEAVRPEKIILFGSAARGSMGPNSDIDLLVLKGGEDALDLMGRIYGNLEGAGAAVDAIVAAPEDAERLKDSHPLVFKPALQEGRVVYEAP